MNTVAPSWPAKHNWRYISRATPPKRAVRERICDFDEIYGLFDEKTAERAGKSVYQLSGPCLFQDMPARESYSGMARPNRGGKVPRSRTTVTLHQQSARNLQPRLPAGTIV